MSKTMLSISLEAMRIANKKGCDLFITSNEYVLNNKIYYESIFAFKIITPKEFIEKIQNEIR